MKSIIYHVVGFDIVLQEKPSSLTSFISKMLALSGLAHPGFCGALTIWEHKWDKKYNYSWLSSPNISLFFSAEAPCAVLTWTQQDITEEQARRESETSQALGQFEFDLDDSFFFLIWTEICWKALKTFIAQICFKFFSPTLMNSVQNSFSFNKSQLLHLV